MMGQDMGDSKISSWPITLNNRVYGSVFIINLGRLMDQDRYDRWPMTDPGPNPLYVRESS